MKITEVDFLAFDTETTGLDLKTDRVVQFGAVDFSASKAVRRRNSTHNPGIPIPAEAQAVHHISDDVVRDRPPFSAVFPQIREQFDVVPLLVGFNCRRFDVPMIDAEFARASVDWHIPESRVLDLKPFVDWYHRGERKRTQEAIGVGVYGLQTVGKTHSAAVDAQLTGELLLTLVAKGLIPDDVDRALAEERRLLTEVDAEFERWSYWVYRCRQTRRLRMGAGAHCGRYLSEVAGKLSWYLNNIADLPADTRRVFEDAKAGRLQNELQQSMVDVETQMATEVKWGGWR